MWCSHWTGSLRSHSSCQPPLQGAAKKNVGWFFFPNQNQFLLRTKGQRKAVKDWEGEGERDRDRVIAFITCRNENQSCPGTFNTCPSSASSTTADAVVLGSLQRRSIAILNIRCTPQHTDHSFSARLSPCDESWQRVYCGNVLLETSFRQGKNCRKRLRIALFAATSLKHYAVDRETMIYSQHPPVENELSLIEMVYPSRREQKATPSINQYTSYSRAIDLLYFALILFDTPSSWLHLKVNPARTHTHTDPFGTHCRILFP